MGIQLSLKLHSTPSRHHLLLREGGWQLKAGGCVFSSSMVHHHVHHVHENEASWLGPCSPKERFISNMKQAMRSLLGRQHHWSFLALTVFHHLTSGMPWSLTSLRAHMILRKILREQRLLIIWMMQFNIPSQNKMSVLINLFHWFCTHLYKYFIRKVITSDTPQQTVLWFKQTTRLHVFQLNVLKSPN